MLFVLTMFCLFVGLRVCSDALTSVVLLTQKPLSLPVLVNAWTERANSTPVSMVSKGKQADPEPTPPNTPSIHLSCSEPLPPALITQGQVPNH